MKIEVIKQMGMAALIFSRWRFLGELTIAVAEFGVIYSLESVLAWEVYLFPKYPRIAKIYFFPTPHSFYFLRLHSA